MDVYRFRLEVPCADEFAALYELRLREVADGVVKTVSEQYGEKIGKTCRERIDDLVRFSLLKMLEK
jgi:hypothetical protein